MIWNFEVKDRISLPFGAICFTLLAFACGPTEKPSSTGEFDNAFWIGDRTDTITVDSLRYLPDPVPLFRKEFSADREIKSAVLKITAAGYFQASLNGKKIGVNYLDPAWTNYSKRIYYSEFDLTKEVAQGVNCIGVALGNGFYNLLPMKMWGNRNLRTDLPSGRPVFIAKLVLEYVDGSRDEIVSDDSWRYSYGPIIRNSVYLGEEYDARKEVKGWNLAGYQADKWKKSMSMAGPGGKLEKAFFPSIQVTDTKTPAEIQRLAGDKYLVDMGVNFTGIFRIRMKGVPGDTVSFRFGERIYDNGEVNPMTTVAGQIKRAGVGGPGAPDIAWQEDRYIFGDTIEVWYKPTFTFHTYRYMEISGLKSYPGIQDIVGIALNSNIDKAGKFSSSNPLINSIQRAAVQTFSSNLVGVQSDCPAREKFGYGGDLNATSESLIYNFDMKDFYLKTVYDWVDAINDSNFVDTAPFVGIQYCGLSWESAFLITQSKLYEYYGDTSIVREFYELDLKWMEKVARIHPTGVVDDGLSDHESLEKVPVELTGTGHYLQCARIMKEFANLMGDSDKASEFENLENKLRNIILEKFWRNPVPQPINKQTLFATLAFHNIVLDDELPALSDSLLSALNSKGHFITGMFGTKYALETLSNLGHSEEVFNVVNSREYPGWGHMIDRGATTIWETWKESDNVFSNNHPMFASVSEWFYRWLGGIRNNPEHPGFQRFILNPNVPENLISVESSYISPYGKIVSNWKKGDDGEVTYTVEIPSGSTADVEIPAKSGQAITVTGVGRDFNMQISDGSAFELTGGRYQIVTSTL